MYSFTYLFLLPVHLITIAALTVLKYLLKPLQPVSDGPSLNDKQSFPQTDLQVFTLISLYLVAICTLYSDKHFINDCLY